MTQKEPEYKTADQFHSGLTVRGLFALWLSANREKAGPTSYANYERIVERHILPALGDLEVDYLTVADIDDFLKEKLKSGRLDGKGGLSLKSVQDISWILHSALQLVEWDYSFAASEHAFIQSQHAKREIEVLTVSQAETLTRYLTRHLNRSNAGFLLCLFTGIRISEICSLKDSDFVLEEDLIRIRRTLQRVTMREGSSRQVQETTVEYGPEDSGCRDLVLPTRLSMLLWSILRQSSGELYFLTGSAALLGPRAYQYRFRKVLAECGLPDTVHIHMLRHTFALLWMLRCHDLPGLSGALGHASVKTTKIRYSKILNAVEDVQPACAKYLCLSAR